MEQNTSVMAKKIWNIMRVAFFLLRKGICKRKILLDLNLIMKRGKIARKALQNLMSHHNHHHHREGSNHEVSTVGQSNPPGEYEFSCSNTPLYRHYFTNNKRKNHYMPSPTYDSMNNIEDVNNIFDIMMLSSNSNDAMAASPVLPGLSGLNRGVRQLRITDSPFTMETKENNGNNKHVDVAAEDFINMFYSQLKSQKN